MVTRRREVAQNRDRTTPWASRRGKMDNLESAITDVQEEIAQVRSRRAELDQALEALETRWRMLEGKPPEIHRHRCPHCGAYSVCPQAYGEDCPLEATAPADCRDDPYREE